MRERIRYNADRWFWKIKLTERSADIYEIERTYLSDWLYGLWKEHECKVSVENDRSGADGDGSYDREESGDGNH